jgi:hypothetical protein
LGIGDWAQSPIPNPQSPIPNPQSPIPKNYVLFSPKKRNFNFDLKKYISKIKIFFLKKCPKNIN